MAGRTTFDMEQKLFSVFLLALLPFIATVKGEETALHKFVELSASHNLSEVRYLLWTRANPGNDEYFPLDVNTLKDVQNAPFNDQSWTYFLIHGWGGSGEDRWITDSKTNLLTLYDCNVIAVDWSVLADPINYHAAVKNVYLVANLTAALIDWIVDSTELITGKIHITGHSLGGQMAGLTGKHVTVGTVSRVTGLDPAGPLFYTKPPEERIDSSDAEFVDIIHSNGGALYQGCVGLYKAVGDVDFYPNGGKHQAGCTLPLNFTGENLFDMFSGCSHSRAPSYWVESILAGYDALYPQEFWSWPCDNYDSFIGGNCTSCGQGCLTMGLHVSRNCTGNYYLETDNKSPYAMGFQQ